MMNNKDTLLENLRTLGLTNEQGKLYLELLKEPSTHLRLAHSTGINRTKVYRLIDDLEKLSLVTRRTDDRGTFLVATNPSTLEVELVNQEQKLEKQRAAFKHLMPALEQITADEGKGFVVLTYEGIEGFKQMLWHELKTQGEELIFGCGTIDDLVPERQWAEKHRQMTVDANYTIRELLNPGDKVEPFTLNQNYMHRYTHRDVSKDLLRLENQICIYNDTVATYHWRDGENVGFEVISESYARTMRQLFEHYWQLAGKK